VEEHKIKSAWEIAQEKIARMPDLTSEELIKQKEREFEPIGEAIAKKYLGGGIRATELKTGLIKYRGAEGQIVKQALISSLAQSIELGNDVRNKRAMEGFQVFAGASIAFEEARNTFDSINSEFEQEIQQRHKMFETLGKDKLQRLGISGSAIRPNVKGNEDWQHEENRIRQSFDMKVDRLRKDLVQLAQDAQL